MQVTFTGIKNVGFIKIATNNSNTHVAKQDSENMKKFYKTAHLARSARMTRGGESLRLAGHVAVCHWNRRP